MSESFAAESPEMREALLRLYREFFDRAEKKRRWSVTEDIPWDQCNRSLDPVVADVVEAFCAVEMYLPDYIGKALPMVRENRGWSSFHSNWGYEESKHSLALGDWLVRSGSRTESQMSDVYTRLIENDYKLPEDSPAGMVMYAMAQELATYVHYKNLRLHVETYGDPALERVLTLVAVDERAHHAFYRTVVKLFLDLDRPAALEQLRRILNDFSMPAVHLIPQGVQRVAAVRSLGIFNEEVFYREVYRPILESIGVTRQELRRPTSKTR